MHLKKKAGIIAKITAITGILVMFVFVAIFFISRGSNNEPDVNGSRSKRNLKTLSQSKEFDIPDIQNTDVLGDVCNCMTPQGICVAGDYVLITAYCSVDYYKENLITNINEESNVARMINEVHHERHNSVMYVVSEKTKRHVTTLVFDDKSHVGGITFDGEYVWVAKGGNRKVEAYRYEDIKSLVRRYEESTFLGKPAYEFTSDATSSFIACYEDNIWVGTHNENDDECGVLIGYSLNNTDNAGLNDSHQIIIIPPLANGAVFMEVDDVVYMAVTTSYGRHKDSLLHIYKAKFSDDEVLDFQEYKVLKLPPMAEEICVNGEQMYFLFESGATTYSTVESYKCNNIVNTVRVENIRDIIYNR